MGTERSVWLSSACLCKGVRRKEDACSRLKIPEAEDLLLERLALDVLVLVVGNNVTLRVLVVVCVLGVAQEEVALEHRRDEADKRDAESSRPQREDGDPDKTTVSYPSGESK